MIDPVHSYQIERSPWLEWNQIIQTGNKFYFGHGAWIDLHWRVATEDVKRAIVEMAQTKQ